MQGTTVSLRLTKSVLAGSTAMMLGLALAGGAYAQAATSPEAGPAANRPGEAAGNANASGGPAEQGTEVGAVVVTGSRIARRDYTSNSPIVTVSPAQFENSANIAIEANLNRLPQFTPAQNMTGVANSGDVQPTATNSIGISTLSLRGLGPNRNLVLADGRRLMPQNGLMVTDVNTIPSALIERVEVITGGASAVYGADAVGGVVNFILRKNFQGFEFDTQWGVTQAGDGKEFKISGLIGSNFADDKGNAMFGLEHYTREPSYEKNRDFYLKGFADPSVPGNDFFFHGANYTPSSANAPSQAAVNALFSGRAPGTTVPTTGTGFFFNPDGTLFTGAGGFGGGSGAAGAYRYTGPLDNVEYGHYNVIDFNSGFPQTLTGLKSNSVNYFVTAPTDRWTLYGSAHYDFNDNLSAYMKGTFVQNKTHTVLFPTPFISGWGVQVPYDVATQGAASGHPVPNELASLLNSRPTPNAPWEVQLIPDPNGWMPPRSTRDTNTNWQVTAGLNGTIPGPNFTWDAYVSHGESTSYSLGEGYASLVRYEALITAPNWGKGASITGNQVPPNFGFGAATGHCTSGFYDTLFLGGTPSQDCIDSMTARIQNTTAMSQNIAEATIQGTLFQLPAGDLGFSVGASYREEFLTYTPDVLQSTVSFADQVAGVYPTAYMNSSWDSKEIFGELLVPIVKDVPGIKALNLELGARDSWYEGHDRLTGNDAHIPSGWTYKIQGDWEITDWLRLRGGYNRAVRAPNLGELFLGMQQVFAGGAFTQYGNPCSKGTLAPFGANPATNPNAANVVEICRALMTPAGAANWYDSPGSAALQVPGQPSGFIFTNQLGNPNLVPETAKTWTAGVVLRSPWQMPWISRFTASVDWYKIDIANAIQFESVDAVRAACFTQAPAAAIASIASGGACSKVSYNPGTGFEAPTTIQFNNLGAVRTSGVDVQLNWNAEFADMGMGSVPGALDASILFNWLDYFDTMNAPGAPWQRWAGTNGPSFAGLQAGAGFKWKLNATIGYSVGPAHVMLNWRHLPSVHDQGYYLGQAVNPGNNVLDTPSHDEFGLYATYNFMHRYTLRAGVDNLFNAEPEITGANTGIPGFTLPTSGQGTTNEGLYDALGRRFYVGLKARF